MASLSNHANGGVDMRDFHHRFIDWVMHTRSFLVVMLGLCIAMGVLSHRYLWRMDLTQNSRNSLSPQSVSLLKEMPYPVEITAFASKDDVTHGDQYRQSLLDFMVRYQRVKSDITLNILSVQENPALARTENITIDGEMVVKYQQQSMHILPPLSEERFTNLLLKLSRVESRHLSLMDGSTTTQQADDTEGLQALLSKRGYQVKTPVGQASNHTKKPPSTLILSQLHALNADQQNSLLKHIDGGGNLLWVVDSQDNATALAQHLGLTISQQAIWQNTLQPVESVGEVYANYYAQHAITQQFSLKTIFHAPSEIKGSPAREQGWTVTPLVLVVAADDHAQQKTALQAPASSPRHVVLVYERPFKETLQRLVIVGDAHFLGNQSLPKGGNTQLVSKVMQWLTFDAIKLSIKPKRLKDVNMVVPENSLMPKLIGYTIQYIIPAHMLFLMFYVLYQRRRG